jgi:hypothetical protein
MQFTKIIGRHFFFWHLVGLKTKKISLNVRRLFKPKLTKNAKEPEIERRS